MEDSALKRYMQGFTPNEYVVGLKNSCSLQTWALHLKVGDRIKVQGER